MACPKAASNQVGFHAVSAILDSTDLTSYVGKMKELPFYAADGGWRMAFAFNTSRHAILFVVGDKPGGSETLLDHQG